MRQRPGKFISCPEETGASGNAGYGRLGFTMVEVVVVLAVMTLISGTVLANFPRLSQRIRLQRSTQKAALTLRRAQNMAFAVRQSTTPAGRIIPPAYGVNFNRASGSYILFADLKGLSGTRDGIYRASDDLVVETIPLDSGVTVANMISDLGGANQPQDVVNVTFAVPDAKIIITNASFPVGESVQIVFGAAQGTKDLTIRTSGQIRAH